MTSPKTTGVRGGRLAPARSKRADRSRGGIRLCLLTLAALALPLLAVSGADAPGPVGGEPTTDAVVAELHMLPVPFSPQIHLDLALPGETPIPVILDTGISYSVGSPGAVGALHGTRSVEQAGAVVRASVLGDLAFRSFDEIPAALSTDRWLRFGGKDLERFVVEIDFEKQRVRFLDAGRFALPDAPSADEADGVVVPLETFISRPRVELEVNGRPVMAAIDTSVTAPLWIGTRDLKLAAVHPKTLPVLRDKGGSRGATIRLYETDSVRIGGIALPRMPILVGNQGQVDEYGPSGPAVGLDLLSQFRVRLDVGRRRLWLRRVEQGPPPFLGANYAFTRASGAFLSPVGDRWSVAGVLPGSPSHELGLSPGDLIDPAKRQDDRPAAMLETLRLKQPVEVQRPSATGPMVEMSLPSSRSLPAVAEPLESEG